MKIHGHTGHYIEDKSILILILSCAFLSPYAYCANNPVNMVDYDGLDWYYFDNEGNYMYKIECQGEHKLLLQTSNSNSDEIVYRYLSFADPENDPRAIDNGTIKKVIIVSNEKINDMISSQGVFDNSLASFPIKSLGNHEYDYSYTVLQYEYSDYLLDSSEEREELQSSALFLPEGDNVAHNIMNFGNYLWAVTGYTLGFEEKVLSFGANTNSVINPGRNGYKPQLDSKDDQYSISLGVSSAKKHNYRHKRK